MLIQIKWSNDLVCQAHYIIQNHYLFACTVESRGRSPNRAQHGPFQAAWRRLAQAGTVGKVRARPRRSQTLAGLVAPYFLLRTKKHQLRSSGILTNEGCVLIRCVLCTGYIQNYICKFIYVFVPDNIALYLIMTICTLHTDHFTVHRIVPLFMCYGANCGFSKLMDMALEFGLQNFDFKVSKLFQRNKRRFGDGRWQINHTQAFQINRII